MLSAQGFWVTLFVGSIVLVIREAASVHVFGDFGALRWFLSGALATPVAFFVLLLVYRPLYLKRKKPVPVWVTPTVYFFLGCVYGITGAYFADLFRLSSTFPLWQRVLNTAIFSAAWGSAMTWYLSVRANAVNRREQLIDEAVKLEMSKIGQAQLTSIYEQNIGKQVFDVLADARKAVFADGGPAQRHASAIPLSPSDTGEISGLLIDAVDESVRPLSAQLREFEENVYPKRERFAILRNMMRHTRFNVWLITPIYVFGTARPTQEVFGFWPTIRMEVIALTYILVVLLFANFLMRRFPDKHTRIFISALGLVTGTFFILLPVREYFIPGTGSVEWALWQSVGLITLIIIITAISAIARDEEDQQYLFSEQLAADKIQSIAQSRILVEKAHEMAQVLHGSVQSRLVAAALELQRASERGDADGVDRALNEARDILTTAGSIAPEPKKRLTLQEELRRKCALWQGLCEIELKIETASTFLGTDIPEIAGKVVEEALSNSIRHGRASGICVSVTRAGDSLSIIVEDNGDGVNGDVRTGGGGSYFEAVSSGNWILKSAPHGARFELTLPLSR